MGLFDTYGDIQLKAGQPYQNLYLIGDKTDIPDGVYVDDDGIVVISDGRFVAQLDKIYDYFGDELDKIKVIRQRLHELDD